MNWDAHRLSFGPAAGLYDRVRPRYPVEALRWMLGEHPVRVVDLGAGTGILTRQLVDLGHDVIAIEPDPGMRAELEKSMRERSQRTSAVEGSAERIPLPDGHADAVVAGQAYHWFDAEPAHEEIARVLRPGGVFAPIWNVRDETMPLVAELSELMDGVAARAASLDERDLDDLGDRFGTVLKATFPFTVTYTIESLIELVMSRSYYLTATPDRQIEIEHAIRKLLTGHPDLAGRTEFALPYVTDAYRAYKR